MPLFIAGSLTAAHSAHSASFPSSSSFEASPWSLVPWYLAFSSRYILEFFHVLGLRVFDEFNSTGILDSALPLDGFVSRCTVHYSRHVSHCIVLCAARLVSRFLLIVRFGSLLHPTSLSSSCKRCSVPCPPSHVFLISATVHKCAALGPESRLLEFVGTAQRLSRDVEWPVRHQGVLLKVHCERRCWIEIKE